MIYIVIAIVVLAAAFFVVLALPRLIGTDEPELIVSGPGVGLRETHHSDLADIMVINQSAARQPLSPKEDQIQLGVVHLASGRLVGVITFRPVDREHDPLPGLEFEITLRDEAIGKGVGREATALSIGWMLDSGCRRVIAGCSTANLAMRSILQKLAGEPYYEGPLMLADGQQVASVWFAFNDEAVPEAT